MLQLPVYLLLDISGSMAGPAIEVVVLVNEARHPTGPRNGTISSGPVHGSKVTSVHEGTGIRGGRSKAMPTLEETGWCVTAQG